MKFYSFRYDKLAKGVVVLTEDASAFWPAEGPDFKFTLHLLSKVLSPVGVQRLFAGVRVLAAVEDNALDIYLPPRYRLRSTTSIWKKLINLFKKEKHHARNQYPGSTE